MFLSLSHAFILRFFFYHYRFLAKTKSIKYPHYFIKKNSLIQSCWNLTNEQLFKYKRMIISNIYLYKIYTYISLKWFGFFLCNWQFIFQNNTTTRTHLITTPYNKKNNYKKKMIKCLNFLLQQEMKHCYDACWDNDMIMKKNNPTAQFSLYTVDTFIQGDSLSVLYTMLLEITTDKSSTTL